MSKRVSISVPAPTNTLTRKYATSIFQNSLPPFASYLGNSPQTSTYLEFEFTPLSPTLIRTNYSSHMSKIFFCANSLQTCCEKNGRVAKKRFFKSAKNQTASSLWVRCHRYMRILYESKFLWEYNVLQVR